MKKFEISAPLWKRAFAYIIDMLIINVFIIAPFNPVFKDINLTQLKNFYITNPNLLLVLFIIAILTIIYFTILEYKLKQTLGKLIFNISVKSLNNKLKFTQVLLRNITKPFILLLILDIFYMVVSKDQRYTEKLSNTKIIQEIK